YQIQNELYKFQCFFKKTMKSKNKIYSSGYHPKVHWYKKRATYLDGLEHSYNYNKLCYNSNIKPIFENSEGEKYFLKKIVSKFLVNHLQVFIFSEMLRSEEHTSELQSRENLVCRLLLEKKKRMTSDE